jgi:hypothetical protein
MPPPAVTNRHVLSLLLFTVLVLASSFARGLTEEPVTISRFKALYGETRDYKSFKLLTLNGHRYILAFWYEDNSPLQLSVNIVRYTDADLEEPVFGVFSGSVAEDVAEIVTFDVTGDGRDELLFLSNSGQIKIVRILQEAERELRPIFENGGTEVTLLKDTREIWIKSRSAGDLTAFRWDPKEKKIVAIAAHPIVF